MTTSEVKSNMKQYHKAAIVGGVIGLTLLVAYVAYVIAETPAVPDLMTAPAAEVVAFVANERGLAKQPQIEQKRFLERWREVVTQDAKRKEELRVSFEGLDDAQRKAFSAELFQHLKRAFMDDAKCYLRMPQDDRFDFLKQRLDEYNRGTVFAKEVAIGFSKQFRGTEDDLRRWVMENTTPEERAIGEPYFQALEQVQEQIRKAERPVRPTSAPASRARSSLLRTRNAPAPRSSLIALSAVPVE